MATRQGTADFILEQIAPAGDVSARKMFGEYSVYCDGKLVALIADDQFFVKPTEVGRAMIGAVDERPPYPGAKPCFWIGAERWEDRDWLAELVRVTAQALPVTVKKPGKRKAVSKGP